MCNRGVFGILLRTGLDICVEQCNPVALFTKGIDSAV